MGGKETLPMQVLLMLTLVTKTYAICPARCQCNDQSLQVICPDGNLQVFPIQLNPEVRHVDLRRNSIYSIHYTLNFYNNLVYLDISHNKLSTLGSLNFISQQNLKYLNVSWNQLGAVSKDTFKGLNALTDLNLSFNYISDIPIHAFRELHSLESLMLTGNQLGHLEVGLFKSTKYIISLYLEQNQFLEVPGSAVNNLHALRHLSLSQNLIEAIAEEDVPSLPELSVLLLDHNLISHIELGALSKLAALSRLDISDNNFTVIPTASLAKLPNLTYFHFSGNLVQSIPSVAFRGLFHLKHLFLGRLEFLTRIDPRAFVDNINLEKVWLDDNIALVNLPTRLFHGNRRVTHISICNNQLTTLDASHFPIDQLQSLRLSGNPWQCNCTLLWLWRLVREQGTRNQNDTDLKLVLDVESILCSGPVPVRNKLLMDVQESVVTCSLNWLTVISAATFACVLLALAIIIVYCGCVKRRQKYSSREPAPCCSDGTALALPYDDKIGPHVIHEYQTLSPWSPCVKNPADIYKQFDSGNVNVRPHVVYV